jgi:hypothetical protein
MRLAFAMLVILTAQSAVAQDTVDVRADRVGDQLAIGATVYLTLRGLAPFGS